MDKKRIALTLGIMCMVLVWGIFVQVKTVGNNGNTIGETSAQSELKEKILKMKEKYNNLYKELENAEQQLENERANATKNNSELEALEEEIKQINKLLGLTEVTGKGIKIVLKDSSIPVNNYLGDINDLVIHDKDIMHIVNALFNSGAEAVSVNDIRIISISAIECNGNVIKIGGEKIGAPFVIKAIGYQELLNNLNIPGGRLDKLRNRTIDVTLSKESEVVIPKYTGTLKLNYIKTY